MKASLLTFIKLVSLVLLILGGIFVGIATVIYSQSEYSYGSNWIEVPADITYTYTVRAYGSKTGSGIQYAPQPTYSFEANDGLVYEGSTYSTSYGTTRSLDFIDGATQTPVVIEGSIFYNPNDPTQSAVLRPSIHPFTMLAVLLFSFLAVFSGCVVLISKWFDKGIWYMPGFPKKKG